MGWSKTMKIESKLNKLYASIIAIMMITIILGSAWATKTITSNKETVQGTHYYQGNYDFINNTHFNITNKIYNSKGHLYNATATNLQLAIYDLNGTGGIVYLPATTIIITTTIWIPSYVTLQGKGCGYYAYNGTVLRAKPALNMEILNVSGEVAGNSFMITLRDIWFNGDGGTYTSATGYMVDMNAGDNTLIERCYFSQANRTALRATFATITNCFFMQNRRRNAELVTDCKFTENEVTGGWYPETSGTSDGSIWSGAGYNLIRGNFIYNCNRTNGISLYSSKGDIICNNRIQNMFYSAIFISSGNNATIIGNMLIDNAISGSIFHGAITLVDGKNNTIIGNIIKHQTLSYYPTKGIYERESGTANYNIIIGNIVQGCHWNISVRGSHSIDKDNICGGNRNISENWGNTSVANNGTIAHGLSSTPTMIQLTSAQENLTAIVTTITSTTFKVMLVNIQTGSPPGGSYYVHWYARV